MAWCRVQPQFKGSSCDEELCCNWHIGIMVRFGLSLLWRLQELKYGYRFFITCAFHCCFSWCVPDAEKNLWSYL